MKDRYSVTIPVNHTITENTVQLDIISQPVGTSFG